MKGKDGHYHVARWPPGWRSDRRRVPAILVKVEGSWQIIDRHGQTWPVASHVDVLAVAVHPYPEEMTKPTKLDVFVDRLPHYPWLAEAMQDDKTTAYARGRTRIGGLICQHGRLKLRIEEAAAWGAEKANHDFLCLLRSLYDLLGVGAYPTPGGLGMSAMEVSYLAAGHERQSRPSVALRQALLGNRIGGRSDWTDSDEVFRQVWEVDQRNSYCSAAALPLPVGGVVRFLDGEVSVDASPFVCWFARCICANTERQDNSPLLERLASGRLVPFTRVGTLERYLFKEEAEAFAKQPGTLLTVLDGWGWYQMAPIFKPWAEKMHQARAIAASISADLERMVKLCIVASIGRHGCRPERRSVIPLRQATDGDSVLIDTLDGEWATHTEPDVDAPHMTVWHDYIVMRIRLQNYAVQVAEKSRQNPAIGSNIDAVYFLLRPNVAHEPDVLGGWRVRDKHNVRFPYIRGLICEEKVALPGLPRGSPQRKEWTNA